MRRRNRQGSPISLFSFQDIVTSVTGILILLSIILAISVITQGVTSPELLETVPAAELNQTRESLARQVAALESQVVANEQQMVGWIGAPVNELEQQQANYQAALAQLQQQNRQLQAKKDSQQQAVQAAQSDPSRASEQAEIESLSNRLEETNRELAEMRAGSRVFYNFRSGSRTAWLVQLSGGQILAGRANEKAAPRVFQSTAELIRFAKALPMNEKYLVLVVRPSGVTSFKTIKEACEETDIDLGVELIGEDQVVVDPTTGAGSR